MSIVAKNKLREQSLKKEYMEAIKDSDFKKLISSLNVSQKEVENNVVSLQEAVQEINNCKSCKGLTMCKNKVEGCNRILYTMHYQQDNLMINKKLGFEDPVKLSNNEHSKLERKFEF